MIAIEISRFVAILKTQHGQQNRLSRMACQMPEGVEGALPTGHSPQRLDTGIHITLTLL